MNRRTKTLIVGALPVIALAILGGTVPVPFGIQGPGPALDAIGDHDGRQTVDIHGAATYPTSGSLYITTVGIRTDVTLFDALGSWAAGNESLVPIDMIFPPDRSRDETRAENLQKFRRSETDAEIAARRLRGEKMVPVVDAVVGDGPASGRLVPGDVLVSVGGRAVASTPEVAESVAASAPDRPLKVVVRRPVARDEKAPRTVEEKTIEVTPRKTDAGVRIGIGLAEIPETPMTIEFNVGDIGGPSAGLMLALAIYDKLTEGELTGGREIAGTGTIDAVGNVGGIGGIRHKLIAARAEGVTVFFVPAANCEEAKTNPPEGVALVKVSTLGDAVGALDAITAGREAPHC